MTREELSSIIKTDVDKNYSIFESYLAENFDTIKLFPKMAFIVDMRNSCCKINLPFLEFPDMWRQSTVYSKKRLQIDANFFGTVFLDCLQPRVISNKGDNIKDIQNKESIRFIISTDLDIKVIKSAYEKALKASKIVEGCSSERIIRQAYINKIDISYEDYCLIKEGDRKILSEKEFTEYTPRVIQDYWVKKAKTSLRK